MKQGIFTVTAKDDLAAGIFRMTLAGDASAVTAPGQFVNIRLAGKYLRRPISVCDYGADSITLIVKILGHGTEQMHGMSVGETLDVLTGLGNGYDIAPASDRPLLIGGGVGIPPLYRMAKDLRAAGRDVRAVLGFNTADEIFYAEEFAALGVDVTVATADGSRGVKGFVTDALPEDYSYFYTCGPEPMLKAVYKATVTDGQFSFEERMGCGFGACMGCSCKTVTGYKRICKDGPVLRKEEILWND